MMELYLDIMSKKLETKELTISDEITEFDIVEDIKSWWIKT